MKRLLSVFTLCLAGLFAGSLFGQTPVNVQVDSIYAVDCQPGSVGSIFITVTAGEAPFTFAWSSGSTDEDLLDQPAGSYSVTVTGNDGEMAVLTEVLEPELLIAVATAGGQLDCVNLTQLVSAAGSSSGPTISYAFSTTGGNIVSPPDAAEITVDAPGSYLLVVADSQTGCSATASADVLENIAAPDALAGPDMTTPCSNDLVSLMGSSATSGATAAWTASAGGHIESGETTFSPVIDNPGTFILMVTDPANGCTAVDLSLVVATNEPPTVGVSGGVLICANLEVILDAVFDPENAVFEWSGPNGFTSPELNPIVIETGDYLFSLTDTITGCTSEAFAEVTVDTLAPGAIAGGGGALTCTVSSVVLTGSSDVTTVVFDWTGPNNYGSDEQNPTVSEVGNYFLTVIDTINGCQSGAAVSVFENKTPPVADAGLDGLLNCNFTMTSLNGSGSSNGSNFTYAWTTANGHILSGETGVNPTVDLPGDYQLLVTDSANGCTASDVATVNGDFVQPTVSAAGGTLTCVVNSINLTGNFDSAAASASWSGPNSFTSTEQNPAADQPGDYVLTITQNSNGCTASATATILEDRTAPDASATGASITCLNPSPTISANSTTPNAVFEWTAAGGIFSTDQTVTVSLSGDYAVIVTNPANGCTATASASVLDETTPPAVFAGDDGLLNCYVQGLVLNGSGSQTENTTFAWTTADGHIVDLENTLFPSIDAAGTYQLLVTDTLTGCTAADDVVVVKTPAVEAMISVIENVKCPGGADGSAEVLASGGVGNFIFGWSNGGHDATVESLIAGNYSVTVIDGEGCSAVAAIFVLEPQPLLPNATATQESAANADDGTATSSPTGGTAPYTFLWSNFETTQTITGLVPASFRVTVTDAAGCTATEITNSRPFGCELKGTISHENVSCNGLNDGSASVLIENANGPVGYLWNTLAETESISGLAPGNYQVLATDATGCEVHLIATVSEPLQVMTAGEVFHNDVLCADSQTGFIVGFANGGTQPYQFSWSNGGTQPDISDLNAGLFDLVATDVNGCTAQFSTQILALDNEPPVLLLQNIVANLASDGTVNVAATDFDNGSFDLDCSIASWSVVPSSFDCSQIGQQEVVIAAVDGNGNISSANAFVEIRDVQTPVLTCPASKTVSFCHAVQIFDLPVVGDNCSTISANLAQAAGMASGAEFPLGTTVQSFIYVDGGGNQAVCSFEITVVGEADLSALASDVSCFGNCDGSISLSLQNGLAPFSFEWNSGATTSEISLLCTGDYDVIITDGDGCTQTTSTSISEPEVLTINVLSFENPVCANSLEGSISVGTTGGTPPVSFAWSNGGASNEQANLTSGSYEIVATDANGCTVSTTQNLVIGDDVPPTISIQEVVFLELDGNGKATLDFNQVNDGTTDNCGLGGMFLSDTTFDCSQLGSHILSFTATDLNGNTNSALFELIVEDKKVPVLACPNSIFVSFCHATVTYAEPTVVDNCPIVAGQLQLLAGLPSGSVFPVGVSTQTFGYTDASGNQGQCFFTIEVIGEPTVTPTFLNAKCNGTCDGIATLTVAGGLPPFSYLWSNGQTTPTATDLCAGPVSVTVEDAGNCPVVVDFTVTQPAAISLITNQLADETDGDGTGLISITMAGGTAPFTFSWTKDGQPFAATTEDLANLHAGIYVLTAVDANGCFVVVSFPISNIVATIEPAWANDLKLLPNPANDFIRLNFDQPTAEKMQVRFFDAAGRLVRSEIIESAKNGESMDVSSLPAGIWQVQIQAENGESTFRKLVITH